MRNFLADRANQLVLAIFTATFLYTLVVLRSVRTGVDPSGGFVPTKSIHVAVLVGAYCPGTLAGSPEIPGLNGRKMSKSYGNAIALSMTEDETAATIKRTRTHNDRVTTFDPQDRPGVSALLTTDAVNGFPSPRRNRRANLSRDSGLASRVLARGNDRANAVATKTLDEVRDAMGTTY